MAHWLTNKNIRAGINLCLAVGAHIREETAFSVSLGGCGLAGVGVCAERCSAEERDVAGEVGGGSTGSAEQIAPVVMSSPVVMSGVVWKGFVPLSSPTVDGYRPSGSCYFCKQR